MEKAADPGAIWTCTSTRRASAPSNETVEIRATINRPFKHLIEYTEQIKNFLIQITKSMTARLCIYSRDKGAWAGSAPQAAWYQFALTAPTHRALVFPL